MALQKTISSQYGVDGNYIKIDRYNGDKDKIRVSVVLYLSGQARVDEKDPLQYWMFELPTPSTDLLPALYTYLKTLPEFEGAIDC